MRNNVTHISHPNISKVVLNNFDRFFYILFIITFLFTYKNFEDWQIVRIIEVCAAMTVLLFIISRLLKRAIHAFTIHWDENIIEVVFYKTKSPRIFNFSEVEWIQVNGAIYLKIKNKIRLFSTDKYSIALPELNKILKIQWGKYCDYLGPNREARLKLEKLM